MDASKNLIQENNVISNMEKGEKKKKGKKQMLKLEGQLGDIVSELD